MTNKKINNIHMKYNLFILGVLTMSLLNSCKKDETPAGYLEPIAITSPTTNPTQSNLNKQINLGATFTTDNLIDSVMISYQLDSTNEGYSEFATSPYVTVKFPTPAKNIQSVNIPFITKITSQVVKKIYVNFKLIAGSRTYNKQLTIEII